MSDQKEMKRRLKVLMQKPENMVCSDCPERQPRWASLIVPPPGSPPGSSAIGAFCCLECSGSHRRLGVHISFVRSVNLDSWKEKEVLAMENGGNKKVNAIWEANLERVGGRKPTTGADLTTRERYIRDKYERRRFYDPQALVDYQNNEPSFDDLVTQNRGANEPEDFANFGPPPEAQVSDAAKLRAAKNKKKVVTRNKSFNAPPTRTKSGGNAPAGRRLKRQESEPQPSIDLLDLGADPGPTTTTANSSDFADFFSADINGSAPAQASASPADLSRQRPEEQSGGSRRGGSRSRSKTRNEMRTKSKTPDREKTRRTQQMDILSMYNSPVGGVPAVTPGVGMDAFNNIPGNNQAAMMAMMQQMSMNPQQMQQMSMNAQQMQQPGVAAGQNASGPGGKHNSRLAMHQNLVMQQTQAQMQQQQNLLQLQRMMNPNMMQQQPGGGMTPQMMQAMMVASQNNNMMMHGGHGLPNGGGIPGMNPNMMMGMNPGMMGMNPMMMQQQPQMNQFGGMAMPMGSGPAQNGKAAANQAPEKEDPFAQFGMNAFR